jgi:hypothetical protein
MNNNDISDKTGSDNKASENNNAKAPSEFFIGLTTFIIFLLFMTVWMYFST